MANCGCVPNKASYRILLDGLCEGGELKRSLVILDETLKRGFMPYWDTTNMLLDDFAKVGRVHELIKALYGLMNKGFSLVEGTWNCMVTIVYKERKLVKITQLFQRILEP